MYVVSQYHKEFSPITDHFNSHLGSRNFFDEIIFLVIHSQEDFIAYEITNSRSKRSDEESFFRYLLNPVEDFSSIFIRHVKCVIGGCEERPVLAF